MLKVEADMHPQSISKWFIDGKTVSEKTISLSVFLRIAPTSNAGPERGFIHSLVYNEDIKADKNGATLAV